MLEGGIAFIFAHPDDEAFGISGTAARYAASGVRTALVCVTHGEAGMTGGLAQSRAELSTLRCEELTCAAQAIGLSEVALYDFPDGGAESWDRQALSARLEETLARLAPVVVVTFDQDGVTRHPDHIAVHEATTAVARRLPSLCRLYYQVVTCPEEASPEGPALACVAAAAVDVAVDVSAYEPAKRAALRCHRSQAADTAHLLQMPEGALTTENYVLAWAMDGWRPQPGETDLLADLR